MEEIYKRRHQYNEGWTEDEFFYYAKRSQLFAYISLIACVVLIGLPLVLVLNYSKIITILLVILSILGIFLCVNDFYSTNNRYQSFYGLSPSIKNKKKTLKKGHKKYNMSVYVLITAFCLIMVNVILAFLIVFYKKIGEDYYIAEKGSSGTQNYLQAYHILMILTVLLLLANTFCWAFFAFASYITVSEREFLRTLIYIFDMLFILSAFVSLYYISKTTSFLTLITSPDMKLQSVLHPTYIICWIFVVVLGVGTFVINLSRKHHFYFFMGGIILICMFCLAGLQFIFFRDSKLVRNIYIKDCPQQLRNSHQDWIQQQTSCTNVKYSSDCPAEQLAILWEIPENSEKLACLNLDCCNAVADSYARPLFAASFWLLALLFTGFGLTITLFQISTKFQDFYYANRTKDYVFMLLLGLIIILGFCIVFVPVKSLPLQQNEVLTRANTVYVQENSSPIVYPKNWQGVTGCQPMNGVYGQQFSFSGCSGSIGCDVNTDGVRVSILAKDASVLVTKYINSPDLMYIQPQLAQQLLFPMSVATDGFISVQGKYTAVGDFLNNNVQLCQEKAINAPLQKSEITIDVYYLHLPEAITEETKNKGHRTLVEKGHYEKQKHHLPQPTVKHSQQPSATPSSSSGSVAFTQAQNDYLNGLAFIDLTLEVEDIVNKQPIGVTEISFYKSKTDCGKLNQLPIRIIKTNDQGKLTMYNMVPNDYNIGLQRDGFYFYCNQFTLEKPESKPAKGKNTESRLVISLVKKNKKKGQFTVVLESMLRPVSKEGVQNVKEPSFHAYLGGSFNVSSPDKVGCLAGFYNDKCGGMTFYNSRSTQVISIDSLVQAVYTFFVQFAPTDVKMQLINEVKSQGQDLTADQVNSIINDDVFDEISPTVTFYAQEQDGPIVSYEIPSDKQTSVSHEPNLIWVSLCVDGRIGDISQASPEQFWTYATSTLTPAWFQRNSKDTSVFPNSQFCQNFYDQNKQK